MLSFSLVWRSPDTSRVRSKMLYASSKDRFKRELDGIQVELQATDPTEMGLDVIQSRANWVCLRCNLAALVMFIVPWVVTLLDITWACGFELCYIQSSFMSLTFWCWAMVWFVILWNLSDESWVSTCSLTSTSQWHVTVYGVASRMHSIYYKFAMDAWPFWCYCYLQYIYDALQSFVLSLTVGLMLSIFCYHYVIFVVFF